MIEVNVSYDFDYLSVIIINILYISSFVKPASLSKNINSSILKIYKKF